MYSAQNMSYIPMKRKHIMNHVLRGEDNGPVMNDKRTSLIETWSNFISGNYLSSMWPVNNSLSVTVVNDKILNSSEILLKNSTENKDMSYILQEKTLVNNDLKQSYSKDYIESMLPISTLRRVNHSQDWHIVNDFSLINIKNYMNLTKKSGDTYENNSTMESHSMLRVNETEKTMKDKIIDTSGPLDVDPHKREVDIHKDTDVESFLVVSHSDVPKPTTSVGFVTENPMSRFSNVCRNAWNSLTNRLYCQTKSARMSVKRPLYSKQYHRKKANAIAVGRGRGRAKCQLRRSGVSQTICRKECIKYDDEAWQDNLVTITPNDCSLDSKLDSLDNMDIPDPTQITKQVDSPAMSNSSKGTSMKEKPKERKKKKTKAEYMSTKVRYIASSRMNDYCYCENNSSEISDAEGDSFRSRTLSESSVDDGWIVFEEDDEIHGTCEKQGTTEYPTEEHYVPNSSMRNSDNSCKDFNSKTHNAERTLFRLRSSSESSEDSNYSSKVSDEQETMECPRIRYDCLAKISNKQRKDCNSQMQKKLFQHRRLPSDSSESSDDSNSSENSENSSFATEESDDVDGCDEMSFHDGDSQLEDDSIVFVEDSEELIAQTKKVLKDLNTSAILDCDFRSEKITK